MINLDNISFDYCIKCTVCTVYCPVARVTHLFSGPKHLGPDTERLRKKNPDLLDESVQFCTNCKRCEIACPSDVKITDFIQNARFRYVSRKLRIRDYVLSRTDLVGRTTTCANSLVNTLNRNRLLKALLDKAFNIPTQRALPSYARGTFNRWYRKRVGGQQAFAEKVVYFHGCYVNYNDHDLGRAVLTVLNAMNFGVVVTNEKCCGVPLIAGGYITRAKKNARFNINSLAKAAGSGALKIVSASSTCTFALRFEYANLLGLNNSAIAGKLEYITQFISRQFDRGNVPDLSPVNMTVAFHSPCHLERMGGVIYTIDVLKRIPGLKLILLHSECCGISGTYGFKKEYYQISQDVGADLFRRIETINPDAVVTDCETCKWQIEMNTPYTVVHPVMLLAKALKTEGI